ncbi:MAG: aminopeptidase P N-terminal domain-containing protein [Bacteroidetes bacterium]|nr:aminopeptidase P N-terminal domain-containing protein [Bacteroidota bacterium]
MRYEKISPALFIKNRKKINLGAGEIAVFTSNDPLPTNANGVFGFIQNSNFFYLTGIDQEDSYLIINPYAKKDTDREILFVRETNEKIKVWEGEKLSKEEARDISGIENVKWSSEFWGVLAEIIKSNTTVCFHQDVFQGKGTAFRSREKYLLTQIKRKFAGIKVKNITETLNKARQIKETEEIELIKKAIEITGKGLQFVAKNLNPEKYEYEIEADLSYIFLKNRSRHHAFEPIVASGKNACVLHYVSNNERCKAGDMVLLDFGAEYANYKGDMTRVLPVSGTFSDRQREVYESVLEVFYKIRNQMVTGNTIQNLKKETQHLIGNELIKLKICSKSELKNNQKLLLKYFPHGVSHHLGLDVHDVGDREVPLSKNMILTCEPGIYIPEENLGIRLENDILITENGNIDLMEGIPMKADEIEKMMQK